MKRLTAKQREAMTRAYEETAEERERMYKAVRAFNANPCAERAQEMTKQSEAYKAAYDKKMKA